MAYSKKVAACVVGASGKIYDEDPKGVIAVPFDEEFKVRVINKNDRKIGFDVFIDGEKVTKTGRIIVNAHDRIDLERYIENDNNGTKFRYVPKNSQEARMEGKDKEPYTGVVEVRAYFEKEIPKEIHHHHDHYIDRHHHHYDWPRPYIWYCDNSGGYSGINGLNTGGKGSTSYSAAAFSNFTSNCDISSKGIDMNLLGSLNVKNNLEEGAVVRGGNSNQSFCSTYVDLEDDYISLKMYLMGYYPSEIIRKKVEDVMIEKERKEKQLEFDFVKVKVEYCTRCGYKINKEDNFCGKCGASA